MVEGAKFNIKGAVDKRPKTEAVGRVKGEIAKKLEIIKEKQLNLNDDITDGKYSGKLDRVLPNGDIVMKRGSSEKIYQPTYIDKIPRRE